MVSFDVTFADSGVVRYAIHTNDDSVETALVSAELIDVEMTHHVLYVTFVCSEELDWD